MRLDCEGRLLDFGDVVDAMTEDTYKHNVESFRNGMAVYLIFIYFKCTEILAVLSSKPQGSTGWRYPHKKVMLMRCMLLY